MRPIAEGTGVRPAPVLNNVTTAVKFCCHIVLQPARHRPSTIEGMVLTGNELHECAGAGPGIAMLAQASQRKKLSVSPQR
jgi:hypothetical protein